MSAFHVGLTDAGHRSKPAKGYNSRSIADDNSVPMPNVSQLMGICSA